MAVALTAAMLALAASPALAQAGSAALTTDQLKKELFGVRMEGVDKTAGITWRECIEPDGDTLFETGFGALRGKLTIRPGGQACFAYEDDGFAVPSCFVIRRDKGGFRFEDGLGALFITTKVVTGVRTCEKQDLIG